jgi:hypothetical protein
VVQATTRKTPINARFMTAPYWLMVRYQTLP